MTIPERIEALRNSMSKNNLDAYIISGTDPHQSEIVADHWMIRAWISGFTGSAGVVVVTKDTVGLWADGRYFIQAENQIKGLKIKLFKMGLPDVPTYMEWLYQNLSAGSRIGFDGSLVSITDVEKMKKSFRPKKFELVYGKDLVDIIWTDRPKIPEEKIFVHQVKYAGITRIEKFDKIKATLKEKEYRHHLITALDDIAWTFNIRGTDTGYSTPVTISFALVSGDEICLFINKNKLTPEIKLELENDGVHVLPYEKINDRLSQIPENEPVLLDPKLTSIVLFDSIPDSCTVVRGMNIPTKLKAIKNSTEIEGLRNVSVKDGVGLVNFLFWLENNVGKGNLTEYSIAGDLKDFRSKQDNFVDESFDTIAGYKEHGAMAHYKAEEDTCLTLKQEGFLVLDSGGQYYDGTTDVTRTIHFGMPTDQEKKDYTLVLRGNIALATTIFPEGTKGYQIDAFARKALWDQGRDYRHGTGHGVGYFLNVHEGPQSISTSGANDTIIEEGMHISNEPGIYREGKYGIRIENMLICKKVFETEFGKFLTFETLTLCPIEIDCIDKSIMADDEIRWINDYHKKVYEKLSPTLDSEVKKWLKHKTRPI